MHGDQSGNAPPPASSIQLHGGGMPGAVQHILQLAPTPDIGIVAWIGDNQLAGDDHKLAELQRPLHVAVFEPVTDLSSLAQNVAELIGVAGIFVRQRLAGFLVQQISVVCQQNLACLLLHLVIGNPEDTLAHRHDKAARRVTLADRIPPDQFVVILLMLLFAKLRQGSICTTVLYDLGDEFLHRWQIIRVQGELHVIPRFVHDINPFVCLLLVAIHRGQYQSCHPARPIEAWAAPLRIGRQRIQQY